MGITVRMQHGPWRGGPWEIVVHDHHDRICSGCGEYEDCVTGWRSILSDDAESAESMWFSSSASNAVYFVVKTILLDGVSSDYVDFRLRASKRREMGYVETRREAPGPRVQPHRAIRGRGCCAAVR